MTKRTQSQKSGFLESRRTSSTEENIQLFKYKKRYKTNVDDDTYCNFGGFHNEKARRNCPCLVRRNNTRSPMKLLLNLFKLVVELYSSAFDSRYDPNFGVYIISPSSKIRPKNMIILLLLFFVLLKGTEAVNINESSRLQRNVGVRNAQQIKVGIILPHSLFEKRDYKRSMQKGLEPFEGFLRNYTFNKNSIVERMFKLDPSPTDILNTLCNQFLSSNVSAIIYLTRDESYGRHTASSQYFLQLAGYLGIPVIAWNADNSGLEQASQSGLLLQVAPSIHHQASAMLSILVRYEWHAFTIITSYIAGHTDFVQAVSEQIKQYNDPADLAKPNFKFRIIDTLTIENPEEDLKLVASSEARILLLYSTKEEAKAIVDSANRLELTGKDYIWIVTQSVIGKNDGRSNAFPVGMLGVHFETGKSSFYSAISQVIRIFGFGVLEFLKDERNDHVSLKPNLSCDGEAAAKWSSGDNFYRVLRDAQITYELIEKEDEKRTQKRPQLSFLFDGTRFDIELKIMNLRDIPGGHDVRSWEEIGTWKSWEKDGLKLNDIVWPGHQHKPPPGVPEKFHMKIVFLEEPPYISLANADPDTGNCSANRGTVCKIAANALIKGVNTTAPSNHNTTINKCCSGFCIDLLQLFVHRMGFTFELERVEDGKWGTLEDNKWNGLVSALINRKADMALSSLKINSDREGVVDFTNPFMESGISIVVAKRTGIISPTAFLEPFDTASWMLVGFCAIQVAAITIFLFEWLSPGGYNMKFAPPREHKFSLLRTHWLVWAVLFQAAVHVDCPRGFTARFMANIWAMFAVVFLAIYTANLAAFMITREEYHDFSGIDDKRIQKPTTRKPPYRFGTVPFTNAEAVFAKHLKPMHRYMSPYNKSHVNEGIKAIKTGELDAFFYDATVLDYLVGQDEECRLLTVGTWYGMSGYGLAFTRGSKYTEIFNKILMSLKDSGELERLQRFWLTGACKPKNNKRASEPLALEQFLSAYLLLFSGVIVALLLLLMEHAYFKYLRKYLRKHDTEGCCTLISLSMGKSLTFRGAVYEAQDKLKRHRCTDPLCDTHIWKVKHELDVAKNRINQLEKVLESHGVKPNRKFNKSDKALLTSLQEPTRRDMTHNHIFSNDPSSNIRVSLSTNQTTSSNTFSAASNKIDETDIVYRRPSREVALPSLTTISADDDLHSSCCQRSPMESAALLHLSSLI